MNPPEAEPLAWFERQRQRYWDEPECARQVWDEVLPVFLSLPDPPPPDWPAIELALLLCQLAYEMRALAKLEPVLARALPWCEGGRDPQHLPRLLCVAARLAVIGQRYELAAELLQRAGQLLNQAAQPDPVSQGLLLSALGQLTLLQGDAERALGYARQALHCFRDSGYGGPWVQVYAAQAVPLRHLGWQDERRRVLREGIEIARSQRRWSEATNLATGLIDMALESGDAESAESELALALELAQRADPDPTAPGRRILGFTQARCLALRGRVAEACDRIEPVLEEALRHGGPTEILRRLDDLADWQARAGRGAAALATSRRAHQIRLHLMRETHERRSLQLRQQVELDHAEHERRRLERRAAEALKQSQALETALSRLQALQEELAECSRKASLGALLAGVAHELNTPLGTALTSLSGASALAEQVLASLAGGALVRRTLQTQLAELADLQELALRSLRRALALTESYRPAQADACAGSALAALVQRAWRRALPADCALQLELEDSTGLTHWPGQTLEEVLVQLFQNVERHAYPPGEAGLVRVRAAVPSAQRALLAVEDLGRGIDAALLPHVFEPYVSTQFGRGRSGLGLFIAEAAVRQQLGGRLRVQSRPGAGTCFEIECPVNA